MPIMTAKADYPSWMEACRSVPAYITAPSHGETGLLESVSTEATSTCASFANTTSKLVLM